MDRRKTLGAPIPESEITPRAVFEGRRALIGAAAAGAVGVAFSSSAGRAQAAERSASGAPRLAAEANPQFSVSDSPTPYKYVAGYNNFYEFGVDKSDPAKNAGALITRPWAVAVEGLVKAPKTLDIDDLLKLAPLEERIYRLRCVEGWSMVVPWIGIPLSALIRRVEPAGSARFVEFTTLADRKQMPGLAVPVLDWPYVEGLRLDEALHPLTFLAFGLYGEALPKQNGAPVRLVVPWKYGFKSSKSIVRIRFLDAQPMTSWNKIAPREYGFYANVNPEVDHPRWSQASEQPLGQGGGLFPARRKTLPFNGYAEQVGALYAGMDLKKFF